LFREAHSPVLRHFLGAVMGQVFPQPVVRRTRPACVDVSLRRKDGALLVHLENTAGMQCAQRYPVIDFVPPVGPVELELCLPEKPSEVELVGEDGRVTTNWEAGTLTVSVDRLHVHAVLSIR
jgi:hypothetical protein